MSSKGCVKSVAADCLCQADALRGNPSALGLAFGGLASDGILQTGPRTQGHNRPVAAESQHSAGPLNAVPGPGSLRALRANARDPGLESVLVGISMKRLHAGDHSNPPEARNVRL